MGFFKNKYEKELDDLITRINMNMSNNYKDAAQLNLVDFENALKNYSEQKKINEKAVTNYSKKLTEYKERMKGFTHKDQKPYWT